MAIDFGINDVIEELASQIRRRRCILLLGSAIHVGPPPASPFTYPPEQRPALAGALAASLAASLKGQQPSIDQLLADHGGDLQHVSMLYELARSRSSLIDAIADAVHGGKRPSRLLLALAEMDFPVVLTTNYDDLYERALRRVGKDPIVRVHSLDTGLHITAEDVMSGRPVLVKLHGDISRPESIVITEEDYFEYLVQMVAQRGSMLPLALRRLMRDGSVLSLGYGHGDLNIRVMLRLLREGAVQIPLYAVDHRPDVLRHEVRGLLRRELRYVIDNLWRFVAELYRQITGAELVP